MPTIKLTCPHCGKHLKLSKPLQAGHRALCSLCGHSFAAPAHSGAGAGAPPLHPAHVETAPAEEMPPPASNRQVLAIGLVLSGLLLLLLTTISLVLYFALHKGPADAPVQAAVSAPSDDAASPANSSREDVPPPSPPSPPAGTRHEGPPLPPEPTPVPTDTSTESEQRTGLLPEEQGQVNKTIDRGVRWLKEHQGPNGSWGRGSHEVGLAALPALTLLECGVPPEDNHIQKALHHVRKAVLHNDQTYDLSLTILLLDRFGDPADEKLIQTCALRLVAGQAASGGWTYTCPMFHETEEKDLLFVLRQTQPRDGMDLFVGRPNGPAPPGFIAAGSRTALSKSLTEGASEDSKLLPLGSTLPLDKPRVEDAANALDKGPLDPQAYTKALERLPAYLQKLPALRPPKEAHKMPPRDGTDNSNTQFAILGLSAAQRHKLPLDRTLALIVQRFHSSQAPQGSWNYRYSSPGQPGGSPAMTGAGLLGLAVGLGLAADHVGPQAKPQQLKHPSIDKGFNFLAEFIGKPLDAKRPRTMRNDSINYYFLWTVERCGVLYKRRQIGGKDWYPWGVELLLDHQQSDGHWIHGNYPGSPQPIADTCFALLFLKRANLAKELTKKLEFFIQVKQLQISP